MFGNDLFEKISLNYVQCNPDVEYSAQISEVGQHEDNLIGNASMSIARSHVVSEIRRKEAKSSM